MNEVIEVKGLRKVYRETRAVDGVNFTVYPGDVFGFLGPNGAGKSTTIRMLTSLIRPTDGSIRIFGLQLGRDRNKILSRMGTLVESPSFYGYLSAFSNLKLLSRMSGRKVTDERIHEVLTITGIDDRAGSKVKTYSHGMKQRLGIAQALVHDPELIILDEPANGLDPQGIVEIRELIRSLSRDHGKTIMLSSHILSEVELIANRMVIINKGKTIVEGNVHDLLNEGNVKLTIETPESEKALKLLNESVFADQLVPAVDGTVAVILKKEEVSGLIKYLVENDIEVISAIPVRSLEAYFLSLT